jgi:hypothetical protein
MGFRPMPGGAVGKDCWGVGIIAWTSDPAVIPATGSGLLGRKACGGGAGVQEGSDMYGITLGWTMIGLL